MKGYENLFILFTSFFTFSADFQKSLQQGEKQTSDRKPVGLPFRLKRQVREQRFEIWVGRRKIFIKWVFVTSLCFPFLTHINMSWRSWLVRVDLQLSGRYEPYRLICQWLNVKRPGRCAPWGAQGVDTAYGFFINKQGVSYSFHSFWFTYSNQLSTIRWSE